MDNVAESALKQSKESLAASRSMGIGTRWIQSFSIHRDGVEKLPFEPAPSAKKWLKKHLIIAHSGIQHKSGDMQNLVWSRYDSGDQDVIDGLHTIRLATRMMVDALQRDHRQLVVDSLNEICKGVDLLDPSIHQPFRDTIEPMLADGSVMAWKALVLVEEAVPPFYVTQ